MKQGFEIFSDLYARQENWLSRQDPRVNLIACLSACLAVLVSHTPWLPLVCLAGSVIGLLSVGIPASVILARFAAPAGMVLVLCALRPFLMGQTPVFTIPLGSWHLVATREGILDALQLAAKAFGGVSLLILLSLVTPAHRIFSALKWMHVPSTWVEIATLMYRYIFCLLDHATDVYGAQQTRLGYVNVPVALHSMGILAGSVLQRSFEQAERTHEAMVARGYSGEIPLVRLRPLARKDLILLLAILTSLSVAWAALERIR